MKKLPIAILLLACGRAFADLPRNGDGQAVVAPPPATNFHVNADASSATALRLEWTAPDWPERASRGYRLFMMWEAPPAGATVGTVPWWTWVHTGDLYDLYTEADWSVPPPPFLDFANYDYFPYSQNTYYFVLFAVTADVVPGSGLVNEAWSTPASTDSSEMTDDQPPAAIDTLEVEATSADSVTLTWIAPADNRRVRSYELHYSSGSLDSDADFNAAPAWTAMPLPSEPGFRERVTVAGLARLQAYQFRIRAADLFQAGGLSNAVTGIPDEELKAKGRSPLGCSGASAPAATTWPALAFLLLAAPVLRRHRV